MKKRVFALICSSLIISCIQNNNDKPRVNDIKIDIQTDLPLGDLDSIYITGSNSQIGHWNSHGLPFTRLDSLHWSLTFESIDSAFEYKITLGSWDREGLVEEVGSNRVLAAWWGIDTLLHCNYFGPAEKTIDGQISGYYETLQSPIDPSGVIPSRRMWIWAPYDFRKMSNDEGFDLLFMSDGQNVIDPKTSTYGVDWAVDEALIYLKDSNLINKNIFLVAMDCSDNIEKRRLEYGPGDIGDAMAKYIVEICIPFVYDNYPIKGKQLKESKVFFAGSSMGGVLGFRLATQYQNLFDGVLAFSPAVKVNTGDGLKVDALRPWSLSGYPTPVSPFYIDNGGPGLESQLQPGIDMMISKLDSIGFVRNKDYIWVKDLESYHGELGWRKRFPNAFQWVFNSAHN